MSARRAAISKARTQAEARRLNPMVEFVWQGKDKRGVVMKGEQLAKKYNCLACHQAGSKIVGPSYRDVAAKYRGQPGAAAAIADKIRKGGTGTWGDIPMPPKAEVTEPDMKKIVEWILSIT